MIFQRLIERQKTILRKYKGYPQLPSFMKWVGWTLSLLSILTGIALKSAEMYDGTVKYAAISLVLVGLLIVSISRDKIEDEMTESLRAKSFSYAIVWGVLFTVISVAMALFSEGVVGEEININVDTPAVLVSMLVIHLINFNLFKWAR